LAKVPAVVWIESLTSPDFPAESIPKSEAALITKLMDL
jgi:hypothetical protein